MKFDKLIVIHRAEDRINPNGTRNIMWNCKCECGNECDVRATYLKSNKPHSCGCNRRISQIGKNLEDLTNKEFGYWKVMYRANSVVEPSGKKATVWHCRCKCGTEKDIRASSLKGGTTLSCGCYKHEVLSIKRDLSDQIFGRWKVIDKADDKIYGNRSFKMWNCECLCGTKRDVSEQSLVSGKSISCGCYRKEIHKASAKFKDLSNEKFGFWTVIERADDRFYPGGGRAQMWLCECQCGNRRIVAGNMLKSGISQSCGCLNSPLLEIHVATYLNDNYIQYEQQKTYDELRGVGNGLLSYDFLVYKDDRPYCLIECQGEQHFKPINYFGGEERFAIRNEHDKRKREFANKIGIPLLEIKYDIKRYDDICEFLNKNL